MDSVVRRVFDDSYAVVWMACQILDHNIDLPIDTTCDRVHRLIRSGQ